MYKINIKKKKILSFAIYFLFFFFLENDIDYLLLVVYEEFYSYSNFKGIFFFREILHFIRIYIHINIYTDNTVLVDRNRTYAYIPMYS